MLNPFNLNGIEAVLATVAVCLCVTTCVFISGGGERGGAVDLGRQVMEDVRLHLGDCLSVLREMESGSVDAVVTDPPYSAKTHAGARTTRPGVRLTTAKLITTFDGITDELFLELCRECVRVARRWVVMTCDWRHSAAAFCGGLPVVRCGVWVKPNAAPQFSGDRPGTGWEAVLMLHRDGRKRWNGGGHHAVWVHNIERKPLHPTQKPLALVRKWVELFTDEGETVLDPFMGSGTTMIACLQTGRKGIGIEIDEGYFKIAEKRIAEAQSAHPLFAGVKP